MHRSRRWNYLRQPGHNPANTDCPECLAPSKTYSLGSRLVPDAEDPARFAFTEKTFTCEHRHRWTVRTPLA